MVFKENWCRTDPAQNPFVFSGKMRFDFDVTVNLYDTRPTSPEVRIFFKGKRVSQQPFQIPCVLSSKERLAFNETVNLYVMRRTAPKFCVFLDWKCASQESSHIPRVHFPGVFSGKMRLVFTSHCEFAYDAANCSLTPNIFPRKTRIAGGIPRHHCRCNFSFVPKPGRRPDVDKGALCVKAMLGCSTFKCSQKAGRSCEEMRC